MTDQLIDVKAIAQTVGVKVRVCNERILKHPEFPRPAIALNHKTRRWFKSKVDEWISKQAKMQAR